MEFDINLLGVLLAAVASFSVGAFWYSPAGFGKLWMGFMGFTMESMRTMKLSPIQAMAAGFLTQLVMAYVLAHFVAVWAVAASGTMTIMGGLQLGFWIWLGFFATTTLGVVLWEGRSVKLYVLNAAYQLVILLLMSGILAYFS